MKYVSKYYCSKITKVYLFRKSFKSVGSPVGSTGSSSVTREPFNKDSKRTPTLNTSCFLEYLQKKIHMSIGGNRLSVVIHYKLTSVEDPFGLV